MATARTNTRVMTPSEVADAIQLTLDASVGPVSIEGEVSGLAFASSGHVYFQLKDSRAIIKAVVWRHSKMPSGVTAIQGGMMVLARGRISVYGPRSEYQVIVERVAPKGEGALSQAFEILKKKLEAEGLFNPERKREIPLAPRRVALLAAAGSAAASDFITTSVKRCKGAWISQLPVRVQGKGAAEEMAMALAALNSSGDFDLVVMTRGGGSLEDLWAYNEEVLVRAVAASRLPVLAAVGHSTDLSLAEMAADKKAITPTAAAEAVFPLDSDRLDQLAERLGRLGNLALNLLLAKENQLQQNIGRLGNLRYKLGYFSQLLDGSAMRLENLAKNVLVASKNKLESLAKALGHKSPQRDQELKAQRLEALRNGLLSAARKALEAKQERLGWLTGALGLVSPLNVLTRGYAVITGPDGRVIRSASQASPGQVLEARLSDGSLKAKVTSVTQKQ
ncbi:MAG: exodeoxyribonuclease VII large subunit [Deltaproteobacteria bacterium]|jgi:exodeoxyribonuclease VII large subunit|nr:exodeoxyribonuclease VII large subunit [Deltaproteobacteria bacterium]